MYISTILLLLSTTTLVLQTPAHVLKRARFLAYLYDTANVRQAWFLGSPNPPTACSQLYGSPALADCRTIVQQILHDIPGASAVLPLDVVEPSAIVASLTSPEGINAREFITLGTMARITNTDGSPRYPRVLVPWSYQSGTCAGKLELTNPVFQSSEVATWRDVWSAAASIQITCINAALEPRNPSTGGSQVFGESNQLVLQLYSIDSTFNQQQQRIALDCADDPLLAMNVDDFLCPPSGSSRPGLDPGFPNNNPGGEQPAKRPRRCSDGAGDRYTDQSCCDGTGWVPLAVEKVVQRILFRLGLLVEEVKEIGFCKATTGES
ncbi:MAG: hypothetical protein M1835_001424 [Candelina submexicana]|nr:MAG: hypothetical protein M1835_001424 [Candelina submexicana]